MTVQGYYKPIKRSVNRLSGAYQYNPSGNLRWLQRLCLCVLRRIGSEHQDNYVEYQMMRIDFSEISSLIIEQAQAMQGMTGKWPETVILGARQAKELKINCANFPIGFYQEFRGCADVLGMTIIVNPLVDGVILLPNFEIFDVSKHGLETY